MRPYRDWETHLIRIDDGATANVITLRTLTSNVIRTAITAPTTSGTLNISRELIVTGKQIGRAHV